MPVHFLVQLMISKLWLDGSIYAAVILATAATSVVLAAPSNSAFVVSAIFPPWWSAEDVREAVDPIGVTASTGRAAFIVTVYGGAALPTQLRRSGAWLILDPQLIACGATKKTA